jgi:hypothetical protein
MEASKTEATIISTIIERKIRIRSDNIDNLKPFSIFFFSFSSFLYISIGLKLNTKD